MPRSWSPNLTLKLTLATHLAAIFSLFALPAGWPWAVAALIANHAIITLAGLLPRCNWLGPTLTQLPESACRRGEIALTIDDGPDPEVTPQVLDMLDGAGVKASFFCIGRHARQYPALCREIVARGHSIENHGEAHAWHFSLFGYRRMKADISSAQAILGELAGQPPRFFRPTAGLRNPFLDPVLTHLGLQLAAWTRRGYDTCEADPAIVLGRLCQNLAAGDILLIHDGNSARNSAGQPVILSVLPKLLHEIRAAGLTPVTLSAALK
jgi:peptidoglycan/xylan/chitin deacetylase (PgdA/CDA1 family)